MTDRSTTNGPGPDTKSKLPQIPVNPLNKNNQLSSSMFGATTMGSSMDGGGDDYADAEREAREERIDAGQSRSVCSFFLFFVSFLLPFTSSTFLLLLDFLTSLSFLPSLPSHSPTQTLRSSSNPPSRKPKLPLHLQLPSRHRLNHQPQLNSLQINHFPRFSLFFLQTSLLLQRRQNSLPGKRRRGGRWESVRSDAFVE